MTYSNEFKVNVNKLNADEMLLVLLEITHPFLSEPVRLVRDNKDIVSNGETYLAMNFDLVRQSDVQGELPKVTLNIPNVGRTLVRWVDSSGGGRGATISVILLRRSNPDTVEERIELAVDSVNITTELVVFNLVLQNNLVKRAVKYTYDIKRAQGLF